MKCDSCLNSRPIVSENGVHHICSLSGKSAMKCMTGQKDRYVKKPIREAGANKCST